MDLSTFPHDFSNEDGSGMRRCVTVNALVPAVLCLYIAGFGCGGGPGVESRGASSRVPAVATQPAVESAVQGGGGSGQPSSAAGSTGPAASQAAAAVSPREWKIPAAAPGAEPYGTVLMERMKQALAAKGAAYVPRTKHLAAGGAPLFTNRLILESSPYLEQHAHNPVDWHPWGDEAFEKAARLGRPVFLSIGYSTCHWCHVMERESFEDLEIAEFINANFVAVKVDREERPDVDSVYMASVQMLSGSGGWPMTLLLTPEREPFFAGTYFPPRDGERGGRRGLLGILRELAGRYRSDPQGVAAEAASITERIRSAMIAPPPGRIPDAGPLFARVVAMLSRSYDDNWGGFGDGPKFPRPVTLDFLMRYWRRSGDKRAREMAEGTLRAMSEGGIHDHVGGGFHRYSVDRQWLLPHFEKMLYDNAQLASVYLDAFQISGDSYYARVARRILDYVAREMTDAQGGFYSATDADSPDAGGHRHEGLYFVWSLDELRQVLGEERSRMVELYYGASAAGNFEGRNILHVRMPLKAAAETLGMPALRLREELDSALARLYEVRSHRPPPAKDDKVLAAWNGLMISAFARGARILHEERYAAVARKAAGFVLGRMWDGDHMSRSWTSQGADHHGVLDDYAFMAAAMLDLFETDFDPQHLRTAVALHDALERRFGDREHGGYFFSAADGEPLLVREKPDYDGARPSGNSVALSNLLRLYEFTLDSRYRELAEDLLEAFSTTLVERAPALPRMLAALDCYVDVTKEIVIVLPGDGADASPFLERLSELYLPNKVVITVSEGIDVEELSKLVPLVEGKTALSGRVTAYVCERQVCKRPTSDPELFVQQLAKVYPYGWESEAAAEAQE